MKIAIIGNGKMGQAVAAVAAQRGHVITAVVGERENQGGGGISRATLAGADVAIEFTEPSAAAANAIACVRAGVPVVVGTTGWYADLDRVVAEVNATRGAMFWAPNFSIGVAVLSAAVDAAARTLGGSAFAAHIIETHHAAKKDAPSGTAAALARVAEGALSRPVPITSVRTGHVPGTHEVVFDGLFEQVRLVHEARDRRVFADGAVTAAEWLPGRRGVFTMQDMLQRGEDAR